MYQSETDGGELYVASFFEQIYDAVGIHHNAISSIWLHAVGLMAIRCSLPCISKAFLNNSEDNMMVIYQGQITVFFFCLIIFLFCLAGCKTSFAVVASKSNIILSQTLLWLTKYKKIWNRYITLKKRWWKKVQVSESTRGSCEFYATKVVETSLSLYLCLAFISYFTLLLYCDSDQIWQYVCVLF